MASSDPPPSPPQDLGFGRLVVSESRKRLLNRDGTFNVRREGLGFFGSWTIYEYLITVGWPRFLTLVGIAYVVTNAIFAFAYWSCGPGAISEPNGGSGFARYVQDYFFSVQTLATIGYGLLSPRGLLANLIVAVESLIGLLGLALMTGLAFARFARPKIGLRFSEQAVIAPYRGGHGFMFRVVNTHESQLVNAEIRVMVARPKPGAQQHEVRELVPLALERDGIVFFPLTWTIVHPIVESSPLYGVDLERLRAWDAEFLIIISALDETSNQIVHARSSYKTDEVVFGARFKSILGQRDGMFSVDVRRLSEIEILEPAERPTEAESVSGTRGRP